MENRLAKIEYSNLMGHHLQNLDGIFIRNTNPEKFEYWKLCLTRSGITQINILKERKNLPFRVMIL